VGRSGAMGYLRHGMGKVLGWLSVLQQHAHDKDTPYAKACTHILL
jgi:hypothetical protein